VDSDFDLRTDEGTDYVERWGDLSGNQHHVNQGSASQQPERNDAVIFDGSDDNLQGDLSSGGDDIILWAVVETNSDRNEEGFIDLSDGSSTNTGALIFVDRGSYNWRVQAESEITVAGESVSSGVQLLVLRYTSNGLFGRRNGSQKDTGVYDGPMQSTSAVQVGSLTGFRTRFNTDGAGYLYGHAQGAAAQSDAELVEGWAAHKIDRNYPTSLTDKLPPDHPFKNKPPTV